MQTVTQCRVVVVVVGDDGSGAAAVALRRRPTPVLILPLTFFTCLSSKDDVPTHQLFMPPLLEIL